MSFVRLTTLGREAPGAPGTAASVPVPRVTRLGPGDLGAMMALQRLVTAGLAEGFVRAKSEAALRSLLAAGAGAALGIFAGGRLAAMSLLSLPGGDRGPGEVPFPLVPDADWPLGVAFLENTIVHPEARGRGWQRALIAARLAEARTRGRRWLCAGVHLDNRVSWRNLLRSGLAIVGIRDDFGYPVIGLLRSVDPTAWAVSGDDPVRVAVDDEAGHRAALGQRWIGLASADGRHVSYRRLLLKGQPTGDQSVAGRR